MMSVDKRTEELATDNHDEHAGYPYALPGAVEVRPGWWVVPHTIDECVKAYRHHAQKMSES